MLVLIAGLCLRLSILIVPAERQPQTAASVRALGGRVNYANDYLHSYDAFPNSLLRRWLPREYFDDVRDVYLAGSKVTDADLSQLRALKRLQSLWLNGTCISDAGLAQLHDLKTLQRLSFSGTCATLEGRSKLQRALPECRVAGP